MSSVSIIIPAFNEEAAIEPTLQAIKSLGLDAEIIVVDDGSTDRTSEFAMRNQVRVIRHPVNCGYGRSMKDAIRQMNGDIVVMTDADGTYPIQDIPRLLEEFNKGIDMVVGARHGAAYRGSILKMPARFFFKLLVEFTTGRLVPDVNSGLRVFRKSTAERYLGDICDGFSFTTTITLIYMLTGKSVVYLPIEYHKRIGKSKVKMVRDTFRTLQYITECIVRYNPLKFFLLLAMITVAIGAIGMTVLGPMSLLLGFLFSIPVFSIGLLAESVRRPKD